MSANRIIPYGYAVENGKNVIHPGESQIILRIYAEYLGGSSLLRIAQTLTDQKVEFLPGRSDWNKNRIKRILEDERYLGTSTYPAIVGADMQRQARAAKDSSNNQINRKSEIPCRPHCIVECALCGAKMARRHDPRRKASKELWTCQNPDCKQIVNIDDAALYDEITAILNRLITEPSQVRSGGDPADLPMEVRRLANEIDRELDGLDFDRDKVKKDIFALAAEKYKNIDTRQIKSNMLRAKFEKSEPLSSFSPDIFKRTVLKVRLGEPGVRLVLKNDQIIGKEYDDADSEHTDDIDDDFTT